MVAPKVTCDLPFSPIPFKAEWDHLSDLELADPGFGQPGRIDLPLGIDMFVAVLLHGRWSGPPRTPVAFETCLGWVLAGSTELSSCTKQIATCHASCLTGDDILRRFWEIEDSPLSETTLVWKSDALFNISKPTIELTRVDDSSFHSLGGKMRSL